MNPRHWFFDRVLSERQVAVLVVAIATVIALQSCAWTWYPADIITLDKGNVIHHLEFLGRSIRLASVKPLFPFFVGGQVLLVLMAVIFRSHLGLVMATFLPLLWVSLVVVRSS